ncbi:MAG: MATE family efflux transporter [Clostridia bacterium]|nr:MATE family efflux transporter [Clostridia bacterium]
MARNVTRDLTQGSPMKLLLGFAIPLLGGFLFQQLYSFVDTLIVGVYLGYDKLGAVGSTGSLNFMINGFCMGICSGFSLPIAQAFGAKQEGEMRRFVMHAVYLCAVISVAMGLVTGVFAPQLLDMLGTRPDLRANAIAYIRPVFFAIPATVMYNMAAGVMRSLGDGRTPMIAIVIAALLNIALDLLFIIQFQMGVAGAAWATVISQLVSGLWCVWVIRRKFTVLRMQKEDLRWRVPFARRLLTMGIPFGLQYSITAIGSLTVTAAVNGISTEAVSAVTAAGKLSMLFCIVFDALASAMATFAGQNVGAKKLDRIGQGLKAASLVGCIYCALAFVVIFFFGRDLVSLFVRADDPATLDTVLNMAHQFLIVNSALYIPLLFVNIVRFTIQGVGFTTVAMTAGVMELIGRAGVALLLVPFFGFDAAVWANPAAWLLACGFLFPCYCTVMKWLRNRLRLTGQTIQSPKEYSAATKGAK